METKTLVVRIHTRDRETLNALFGTEVPEPDTKATLEGVEVTYGGVAHRHGMSAEDIIITVVLNIVTGISTEVLGKWIFKWFTKEGTQPVQINVDPIVKTKEAEIVETLSQIK